MLACLLSAPAQAADDELLYAQRGIYLGAGGNFMLMTRKSDIAGDVEKSLGDTPGLQSDVDDSFGMNARLGYRLNPKLAVETQFEWASNIEVDSRLNGVASTEKIALMVLTGNAKYFLLTGRIQPYLVAGAGWGRSRVKPATGGSREREDGWAARGGAGVNLYGNRDVAFNLETTYVYPAGGQIKNLDNFSFTAGLTLFFYPKWLGDR